MLNASTCEQEVIIGKQSPTRHSSMVGHYETLARHTGHYPIRPMSDASIYREPVLRDDPALSARSATCGIMRSRHPKGADNGEPGRARRCPTPRGWRLCSI